MRLLKTKKFLGIVFLLFVCSCIHGIDFTTGNYIPSGGGTSASAGAIIVVNTDSTGYLQPDGNSPLHYATTYVGDTSLVYSSSSSSTSSKTYNVDMISSVITGNEVGSITMTLEITKPYRYTYGSTDYEIHYLCYIVRVSGFDDSHDSYSTDYSDWYGDSSCTYETVAILDTRDSSYMTATVTVGSHECLHVVMVPFSYSNTMFFSGSNVYPGTATYTTRYEISFSYSYKNSSDGTTSGTSTDGMNTTGTVTSKPSSYTVLSLGFTPPNITLSKSQLLANYEATTNLGSTIDMEYKVYSSDSSIENDTLYVTVKPYSNYSSENYYFVMSGTTSITSSKYFEANLKLTNISSDTSSVYLSNNGGTTALSTSDVIDTETYKSPQFIVTTQKSSTSDSKYPTMISGDISFDLYPYISEAPTVSAGSYALTVVVEFSMQ